MIKKIFVPDRLNYLLFKFSNGILSASPDYIKFEWLSHICSEKEAILDKARAYIVDSNTLSVQAKRNFDTETIKNFLPYDYLANKIDLDILDEDIKFNIRFIIEKQKHNSIKYENFANYFQQINETYESLKNPFFFGCYIVKDGYHLVNYIHLDKNDLIKIYRPMYDYEMSTYVDLLRWSFKFSIISKMMRIYDTHH